MQQREREQQDRADHVEEVAASHDAAAVVMIGNVPGGQDQNDERQKLRQPDPAQVQGIVSRGIDLPAHRHGLHLHRQRSEASSDKIANEVVLAPQSRATRICRH